MTGIAAARSGSFFAAMRLDIRRGLMFRYSVFTGPESGRVGLTPVNFFGGGLARAKGDPNLGPQVCHIKVTCGGAGAQGCL